MSVFNDLSSGEIHQLGQSAFTAYLDAAFEARKRHKPIDGFLVPAWTAAVRAIVNHLESWGLVRPRYAPITKWAHGTIYGYNTMGCLCSYCYWAYQAYTAAYSDSRHLGLEPGVSYNSQNERRENQPEPGTIEDRAAVHTA